MTCVPLSPLDAQRDVRFLSGNDDLTPVDGRQCRCEDQFGEGETLAGAGDAGLHARRRGGAVEIRIAQAVIGSRNVGVTIDEDGAIERATEFADVFAEDRGDAGVDLNLFTNDLDT